MATWLWHRTRSYTVVDANGAFLRTEERVEERTTEGMTPPRGKGWTLVPDQVPAGRVEGGTGPTKRNSTKAAKGRRGEYDANGIGKVTTTTIRDDGRALGNTLTKHGNRPGASAPQRGAA